jgi:heme exporter protein C
VSINWYRFASPATFYPLAGKMMFWFAWSAIILSGLGLYWGFFKTPPILSEQKEYYRIIFPHVASAWMAMWLYIVMVGWGVIGLIFNTRLSFMLATATAPTGALFTFNGLITGAIWGKTSWGTWWDWDPRMTSFLFLFFLYIGYIALQSAIDDTRRADRASALLAIVGLVMLPIIFWSINCPDPTQCTSLHQRSGLGKTEGNILFTMLIMTLGFWMYGFAVIFARLRHIILERERNTTWVKELPEIGQ